jgi:hypothetical protein
MTELRRTRRHWLAPFWRRLLAGAVDGAVGILGAGALVLFDLVPLGEWTTTSGDLLLVDHIAVRMTNDPGGAWTLWMMMAMPWVLWRAAWGITAGGTPGERVARLGLVDASGMAASPVRGLIRGGCSLFVAGSVGLLLGAPWVSRTQRGVGEMMTRTWLIDARPRMTGGGPARTGA